MFIEESDYQKITLVTLMLASMIPIQGINIGLTGFRKRDRNETA